MISSDHTILKTLAVVALSGVLLLQPACRRDSPASHLDDAEFQELSLRLSEEPGYFDTDNLVSNEVSYQHVLSSLSRGSASGRAYIGVGPGQNFTYISHLRPKMAFVVDIRRENLLFHLYWKVIFELSRNRADFLSRLFAKPIPHDFLEGSEVTAAELISLFRHIDSDERLFRHHFEEIWISLRSRFPELVLDQDRSTMRRLIKPFFRHHLDLQFRSHRRGPRSFYPTFGQLILAADLEGTRRHYLEREEDFQFLKTMHEQNLIVPVVGDFGGRKALKSIASRLRDDGLTVSAYYLSNVEFYLFGGGAFRQFAENLKAMPIDDDSYLVRSHFGNFGIHPDAQPGHFVATLLQSARRFVEEDDSRPYASYWDLITRDYIPLRGNPGDERIERTPPPP